MKDIYLKPTEAGPDLKLVNGLPQLTGGLDNMVYILLMTGAWWGNTTVDTESQLTSDIPRIMREELLTNKARLNIISEATRVLEILLTLGIAETVTVEAEIPNRSTIYMSVKVDEPDREVTDNYIYALNWDEQKITIEENLW